MNELAELKNAVTILEEKCLYSSAKWLCEFISHYQNQSNDYLMYHTNFFERYPCNMTNEYKKAKLHFGNHSFRQAAQIIETVNHFEENHSFLFLWGYSMYMNYQEETIVSFYNTRNNDLYAPYPPIPKDKLQTILSRIDESHCDAFISFLIGLCYKQHNPSKALHFFINSIKEFPSFWGCWTELIPLVQKRSDLLAILNGSQNTVYRDLFWFCFCNQHQDVSFPQHKQQSLHTTFPSWWFIQYQTSRFWYNQGNYEKARQSLSIEDSHDDSRVLLACIAYETKDLTSLTLLASTVSRVVPQTPACKLIIGCFYHMKHQLDQAVMCYHQVLQLEPEWDLAWNLLGQLYTCLSYLKDRYVESAQSLLAIRCFGKCITLSPWDYRHYYHLGLVYELMHNAVTAIHYYSKACELRPYDPHMRVALGEAFMAAGQRQAAIDCFITAESLNETEGVASRRLGALYEEDHSDEGDVRSAYFYRRFLKKKKDVVCDDDSYAPALFLCKYYKKLGDVENFKKICSLLLVANDEGVQKEARQMLASVDE